jgi:hypothetical protein
MISYLKKVLEHLLTRGCQTQVFEQKQSKISCQITIQFQYINIKTAHSVWQVKPFSSTWFNEEAEGLTLIVRVAAGNPKSMDQTGYMKIGKHQVKALELFSLR